MTNNGTTDTTLFEDAMVARNNKADILISLHINSSFDSSSYGAEIFVTANKTCDKYNKNCTELANMILANLGKIGIANRGVKDNKFCSDITDVYSDGTRADWMGIIRYAILKPIFHVPADYVYSSVEAYLLALVVTLVLYPIILFFLKKATWILGKRTNPATEA